MAGILLPTEKRRNYARAFHVSIVSSDIDNRSTRSTRSTTDPAAFLAAAAQLSGLRNFKTQRWM